MSEFIKEAANKIKSQPEYANLKEDVKAVKDSSAKLVSDARNDGPTLAKQGMRYLKEEGANDLRRVEEYVQSHPAKSMLFAALGGVVLSHLLSRKH